MAARHDRDDLNVGRLDEVQTMYLNLHTCYQGVCLLDRRDSWRRKLGLDSHADYLCPYRPRRIQRKQL